MSEILPALLAVIVGLAYFVFASRRADRGEARALGLSLFAHVLSSVAQIWITRGYYGGGDLIAYHRGGVLLAELIRHDPTEFLPKVISLALHQDPALPVRILGAGNTTGAMFGLSGLLMFVWNDSLYAGCIILGVAAMSGQWCIYRVFRGEFEAKFHPRFLVACLLVPSVVFWTSSMLKESIALAGFGWALLGVYRIFERQRVQGAALAFVGALTVGLVKPYIIITLVIGVAVWWYWRRSQRMAGSGAAVLKPLYFFAGLLAALGVMVLVGQSFPRYSFENLSLEAERLQSIGTRIRGGSTYSVGLGGQGVVGQLAFAPLALLTAFFRPFIFEAGSATSAVNALETTAITVLMIRSVLRLGWRRVFELTTARPVLVFSVVFCLTFGVAVGLTATNLGTLSRYRVPLVPFLAAIVAYWSSTVHLRPRPGPRRAGLRRRAGAATEA